MIPTTGLDARTQRAFSVELYKNTSAQKAGFKRFDESLKQMPKKG
jgi:hypothetical protein